jgi:Tol biopolymer transport system component
MSLRTIIATITLALALTACGATPPAVPSVSAFIQAHTACVTATYSTPVWSSDGAQIFYAVGISGHNEIHTMSRQGGNDHRVVADGVLPSPSPDGKMMLFLSTILNQPGGANFLVLDLATSQVRVLTDHGIWPAWSPDSQWIAYHILSREGALAKMASASSATVMLTPPSMGLNVGSTRPLWSPDPGGSGSGRRIAFSASQGEDSPTAVYLMNADGGGLTRLTAGAGQCPALAVPPGPGVRGDESPVAWQPDGKALAYVRSCDPDQMLKIVTLDGVEVTGRGYLNRSVISMEWSPDGKQVLLYEDALGQPVITVADAAGSNLRTVKTNASDPHWSPDGTRIVYVGIDAAGFQEIETIAPDGSAQAQLTSNPGNGKVCLH